MMGRCSSPLLMESQDLTTLRIHALDADLFHYSLGVAQRDLLAW
jgi:hypothetical protein